MRIKIIKGNDPSGLCQYLLAPEKQIEKKDSPILYSNMSGRDAEELAAEFRYARTVNRRVRNCMCHYSVSMPPEEKIGADKIKAVSKALLEKMGHERCQYFIVQHHDREHRNGVQHWHIATSAIALNGKWVNDSFNRPKLRKIEPELEQQFGLQQTTVRAVRDRHNLTTGEYRLKERSGKVLPKEKLWQLIQKATEGKPTMTEFVERIQRSGASVQLYGLEQGSARGISYGVDGVAFPGGKLGPAYSFNGVQEHLGVSYEPERDNEGLRQLLSHPLPIEKVEATEPEPELVMVDQAQQEQPSADEMMKQINKAIARIRQRRINMQNQARAQTLPQTTAPESRQTGQQQTGQQPTEPEPAPETPEAIAKAKPKQDIDWEL
ncbi:MAG: relaxase/mobilization nuclease domain-containing protein [Thermosynechococcaceae cyanobacterium MS004]|nr:relaxase/mobilization nuclease domain-containing protein [Thermosynechococcaceae cyanobacterium MS004]